MEVVVQRSSLNLPVSQQNFKEQAYANLKVGDVCQPKYAEGSQVLTRDEMEAGAQGLCLVLPVSKQSFEERAWWTNGMLLWSIAVKIKNYILRTLNLK